MSMPVMFGIISAACVVFTIINAIDKFEHPLKKSIFGILSGFAGLAAVNILSPWTGVSIVVSVMSVLAAALGGIPGVTLLLAINAFF